MPTTDIVLEDGVTLGDLFRFTRYQRRLRTWVQTPGWNTLKERDFPENSYTDVQQRSSQTPLVRTWAPTGAKDYASFTTGASYWTSVGSSYNVAAFNKLPTLASLTNAALVKACVKVSDAKTNLPVFFAESVKTQDLILGTATRLTKAYRQLRRGDFTGVAKTLNISPKRVHKTWLEYKYGWMPLLLDVKSAAEFLAQQHLGRPLEFCVRASETVGPVRGPMINVSGTNAYGQAIASRTAKAKIRCRISNPRLAAAQQLGLTNPALVAWELIPFSFVFDWFIHVGDWLQAQSAFHGVTVVRSMVSTLETAVHSGSINQPANDPDGPLGPYYLPAGKSPHEGTYRSYVRGPVSVADAQLSPVVSSDPLNWGRIITSLALLRQFAR